MIDTNRDRPYRNYQSSNQKTPSTRRCQSTEWSLLRQGTREGAKVVQDRTRRDESEEKRDCGGVRNAGGEDKPRWINKFHTSPYTHIIKTRIVFPQLHLPPPHNPPHFSEPDAFGLRNLHIPRFFSLSSFSKSPHLPFSRFQAELNPNRLNPRLNCIYMSRPSSGIN